MVRVSLVKLFLGLNSRLGAKNAGAPLLAVATEQGSVHIIDTTKRKGWDCGRSQTHHFALVVLLISELRTSTSDPRAPRQWYI